MSLKNHRVNNKTDNYKNSEYELLKFLKKTSIPEDEMLENLHLFITPQQLRRILFFYEVYQKIIDLPGVVMQFGVRWGREMALLETLRTIFEPFNHSRKIIGFDTFSGYQGVSNKDGGNKAIQDGNLKTSYKYELEIENILKCRENLNPLENIKKFQIIKGDATKSLEEYLNKNKHTVISLAHLDMNIYEPTKKCLSLLKPHLIKGSIVIIDEVNLDVFPGETIALDEIFGLNNIKLRRIPNVNPTWPAYFVYE
jgi:hypothetical protein